jgi:hypothetical protein
LVVYPGGGSEVIDEQGGQGNPRSTSITNIFPEKQYFVIIPPQLRVNFPKDGKTVNGQGILTTKTQECAMKKRGFFLIGMGMILLISSCKQLDVVGKESKTSFAKVLQAMSGRIGVDELTGGWILPAPDEGAAFIWVPDYSKSALYDVMLVFDLRPFLEAGLDLEKLPDGFTIIDDKIMVGVKLGNETIGYEGDPTPLASYEKLVDLKRGSIGYHGALDHYNVDLGNGNLFEWAKDMGKNDKDIVFVLNPEPLIAAGVDPGRVRGWTFAKVPVDINGKPTEVDKFLKPFNLL